MASALIVGFIELDEAGEVGECVADFRGGVLAVFVDASGVDHAHGHLVDAVEAYLEVAVVEEEVAAYGGDLTYVDDAIVFYVAVLLHGEVAVGGFEVDVEVFDIGYLYAVDLAHIEVAGVEVDIAVGFC